MGGGSSDAATTLLALNRLWGLRWPRAQLAALGLTLGADVPFFVGGQNAFVQGIGERLQPMTLQPAHYAVVKPPSAIPTPEWGAENAGFGHNDLQAAAQDRCPEVAQAARWLQARYGNSRMTGSGSAVFARVGTESPPMATFPADELPPGWVGQMCRSLGHHPLLGWAD
jgi:4-diphosphocytidyl-2-C-methyl-D-erythritol kinase